MFDPSWDEGCKSCSFWADNFNGIDVHLNHRDVTFVLVSRAPLATLQAYQRRMGWSIKWVSSLHTDFDRDYHVTFTPEELEARQAYHNYALTSFPVREAAGVSVFYKDADGAVLFDGVAASPRPVRRPVAHLGRRARADAPEAVVRFWITFRNTGPRSTDLASD